MHEQAAGGLESGCVMLRSRVLGSRVSLRSIRASPSPPSAGLLLCHPPSGTFTPHHAPGPLGGPQRDGARPPRCLLAMPERGPCPRPALVDITHAVARTQSVWLPAPVGPPFPGFSRAAQLRVCGCSALSRIRSVGRSSWLGLNGVCTVCPFQQDRPCLLSRQAQHRIEHWPWGSFFCLCCGGRGRPSQLSMLLLDGLVSTQVVARGALALNAVARSRRARRRSGSTHLLFGGLCQGGVGRGSCALQHGPGPPGAVVKVVQAARLAGDGRSMARCGAVSLGEPLCVPRVSWASLARGRQCVVFVVAPLSLFSCVSIGRLGCSPKSRAIGLAGRAPLDRARNGFPLSFSLPLWMVCLLLVLPTSTWPNLAEFRPHWPHDAGSEER